MKKRIALIVAFVLILTCAVAIMAACENLTECQKNGGHQFDPRSGKCTVCGTMNPDFDAEKHYYVNGECTICGQSITSANPDKTIVVRSSQGQSLQTQMDIAINKFQTKYPGWTIDLRVVSGNYDTLQSQVNSELSVDDQPDIALCYPDHVANYLTTRKVVDLSKYVYSKDTIVVTNEETGEETIVDVAFTEDELADFIATFWDEGLATNYADYRGYGYSDDTIFTLPLAKSTEVLYYNKDALTAAGISKAPETWDELWADCEILRQKYPDCTPLGYDSEANWLITMCAQNDWGYTTTKGDLQNRFLFNNADVIRWLQDLQAYFNQGYFTTQTIYNAYTSDLFKKGVDDKGAIFCIGSTGGASNQDPTGAFEVGVAPLPASVDPVTGAKSASAISQGPSLVMFRSSKATNADEKEVMSFLFMKELMDPTFQAQYSSSSGYAAVRYSTSEIPSYAAFLESGKDGGTGGVVAKAVYTAHTMTNDFFTSPVFSKSSDARSAVGSMVVAILRGSNVQSEVEAAIKACGGVV